MFKQNLFYLLLILVCFTSSAFNEPFTVPFEYNDPIQKVRLDFTTPNGYVRHLLLGFTPNNAASDGFDYGYDAANIDDYPDDLNWMIGEDRFVIQGVGAFDETKTYPLGMFLSNSGNIEIKLTALENFNESIDVYIYDSLSGTSFLLNSEDYQTYLDAGDYLNRYYISFQPAVLSVEEVKIKNITINYLNHSKNLIIDAPNAIQINLVNLIDLSGKKVLMWSQSSLIQSEITRIKIDPDIIAYKPYIVMVETNQGIFQKKIIINRP